MANLTDFLATDLMYLSMCTKPINPKQRKGMGRATPCQTRARAGYTWKKETVCLRFKDQTKGPDCTEKMELARIGLGLKELSFDSDGDAIYIHSVLLTAFKQLDACGGYTLLRLATNSTDLIEIQPPKVV